jgi:class 3 adenylate cyclase
VLDTLQRRPGDSDVALAPADAADRCFGVFDLCGFTAYAVDHGNAAAAALVAGFRRLVRREAERRGVRVAKWLGEGVMLTSADPAAAMACGLELCERAREDAALPLRGGLCFGPAIRFDADDYVGVAVNCAARLCAEAAPGQLLASDRTAGRAPLDVATRPHPALTIPGMDAPFAVWSLARG